jgi:hypothetical protein
MACLDVPPKAPPARKSGSRLSPRGHAFVTQASVAAGAAAVLLMAASRDASRPTEAGFEIGSQNLSRLRE